jgi:hypothetical protein
MPSRLPPLLTGYLSIRKGRYHAKHCSSTEIQYPADENEPCARRNRLFLDGLISNDGVQWLVEQGGQIELLTVGWDCSRR